jgi:hypothetical protein
VSYSLAKQLKYKKLRKTQWKQGIFFPKHPEKYVGDLRNIIYRSSWELKFMMKFDTNPAILKWSSEEIQIPYRSPIDGKMHRYFVDFKIIVNTSKGHKTILIEVKPLKQTLPPVKPDKIGKRYISDVMTYTVNQEKFSTAEKYCKERGYEFQILTDKFII